MARKRRLLFIQLPQLDNDTSGMSENLPLAAAYLTHAMNRAGEHRYYHPIHIPAEVETLDDHHLARAIVDRRPAVLAATLYLWNVERTLRIIRLARRQQPDLQMVVGGPEVASDHPFLWRSRDIAYAVMGEGEPVFPSILQALRGGPAPDFSTVFTRTARGFRVGLRTPLPVDLRDALPPTNHPLFLPDSTGKAALEISRGCPRRCSYCRYPHLRKHLSFLPVAEVIRRLVALKQHGAREVRFIDPTFNCHPALETILDRIARINRDRQMHFFAELTADRVTPRDADRLAAANFVEIEVGLQSRDPKVLRAIHRPTDLAGLDAGVRHLTRRGIRVTLDVMYGLPEQSLRDVMGTLRGAMRRRRVNVQCMQTLLLPGTELRQTHARWRMRAAPRPPYGVSQTATLAPDQIARIEQFLERTPALRSDCPARRFAGHSLPDLFPEQYGLCAANPPDGHRIPGSQNRRALLFADNDLFTHHTVLRRWIRRALRQEPGMLWQFVLVPHREEPLDLLDRLIEEIRRAPPHLLDRYAGARCSGRLVARRLFVLLTHGLRWDRSWVAAAEDLLRRHFV